MRALGNGIVWIGELSETIEMVAASSVALNPNLKVGENERSSFKAWAP
jgi:hypothetical protein